MKPGCNLMVLHNGPCKIFAESEVPVEMQCGSYCPHNVPLDRGGLYCSACGSENFGLRKIIWMLAQDDRRKTAEINTLVKENRELVNECMGLRNDIDVIIEGKRD